MYMAALKTHPGVRFEHKQKLCWFPHSILFKSRL